MISVGDLGATVGLEDTLSSRMDAVAQSIEKSADRMTQAFKAPAVALEQVSAAMKAASVVGSFIGTTFANLGLKALSWGKDLITNSVMAGARLEQLGVASRFLGEQAGYSGKYIDDLSTKIEKSGIDGISARESIVQLLNAHVNLADATKLSAIAQNMQSISGRTSSEVFETMTRAISTQNPELLRNIGFSISLEQLKRREAETTGKAVGVLSEESRRRLLLNAIMQQGAEKAGLYGESMKTAGKQASSAERAWAQVSQQIGTVLLPITNVAIKTWYKLGETVRDAVTEGQNSVRPAMEIISAGLQTVIIKTGAIAESTIKAVAVIYNAWNSLSPAMKLFIEDSIKAAVVVYALNTAIQVLTKTQLVQWAVNVVTGLSAVSTAVTGLSTAASTFSSLKMVEGMTSAGQAAAAAGSRAFTAGELIAGMSAAGATAGKSVGLFGMAVTAVMTPLRALSAWILTNPWLVLAMGITAATVAFSEWRQSVEAARLKTEVMAAQQDVVNLAIARGAKQAIDYADALKYNDEWYRRLIDPMTQVNDKLKEMTDNGAGAEEKAIVIGASIRDLAAKGQLGGVQLADFAQKIRELKIPLELLDPALRNIVQGLDNVANARKTDPLAELKARIAAIKADVGKPMDELAKTFIRTAHAAGDLPEAIIKGAAAYGASDRATRAMIKSLEEGDTIQKKFSASVAEYVSGDGGDWLKVQNAIGTSMYEGIAYDLARGKSVETLSSVYRTTKTVVDNVSKAESAYAEQLKIADEMTQRARTTQLALNDAVAKEGERTMSQLAAGYNVKFAAQKEYTDMVRQTTMSTTEYQLLKIDEERDAKIKAYDIETKASKEQKVEFNALAESSAKFQRDVVNKTASTLEDRLRKTSVFTRTELTAQALAFKRTYDQMVASGKYTTDQLVAAWKTYATAAKEAGLSVEINWRTVASDVKAVLSTIPDILTQAFTGGGNLIGAIKALGVQLVNAVLKNIINPLMDLVGSFVKNFFKSLLSGLGGNSVSNLFKSGATSLAGVAAPGLLGGIGSASTVAGGGVVGGGLGTGALGAGATIPGGAIAGGHTAALVGFLTNPITIGVAAALVGGFILYKKLHQPEWAKLGKDIGRDMGVAIPQEMLKAWEPEAKKFGRQATTLLHLDDIIKQAGGLTVTNFAPMAARLRDTFVLVGTGVLTAAQATEILDKNFQAFVDAGTSGVGVLNKKIVELIQLQDRAGTQSKEIAKYQAAQLSAAGTGLSKALSVPLTALTSYDELNQKQMDIRAKMASAKTPKELEKLKEELKAVNAEIIKAGPLWDITKIHSQGAATAIAASLVGIIAANMNAGMSFVEAAKTMGPAVESLQTQLELTGFAGGQAFNFIKDVVKLTSDEIAGPALESIHGYAESLVGMSNIGLMNQEVFSGITSQIQGTEAALEAQGFSGKAIHAAMQGDLQKIWELQQQYNYSVDDSTQALINQAIEEGLVGEKHKSSTQQMIDASNRMVDVLEAMATFMGVTLPAKAEAGAKGVQDALNKIKPPELEGHVKWSVDDIPTPPAPSHDVNDPNYMALGGRVGEQTSGPKYLRFGSGPRGTDVVPAWLTPKERVLTENQADIYDRAMAAPAQGGGDTFQISIAVHAMDNQNMKEAIIKPGGISDILIADIKNKKRGRDQALADALPRRT